MLTKEERTAIAERLKSAEYITSSTLFKALTGEEKLSETSHVKSLCIICSVILGLCDTSNMIELPYDKESETIHLWDTVFNQQGEELAVESITYTHDNINVRARNTQTTDTKSYLSCELAHKKPVTAVLIAKQIKNVLRSNSVSGKVYSDLSEIADQLESLGDSDD